MSRETMPFSATPTDKAHSRAARIVAGARACVGVPFRPQGRSLDGMDCLGVVLHAAAQGGVTLNAPADYNFRRVRECVAAAALERSGLTRLRTAAFRPADILLSVPGAHRVHLAVLTDRGLVEAHAGMRRVIERPVAIDDRWLSGWRLPDEDWSAEWRP